MGSEMCIRDSVSRIWVIKNVSPTAVPESPPAIPFLPSGMQDLTISPSTRVPGVSGSATPQGPLQWVKNSFYYCRTSFRMCGLGKDVKRNTNQLTDYPIKAIKWVCLFSVTANSMVGTMSENTLNATLRTTQGKSSTQLIRRNGKIPAILYGPRGNFSLEMDEESTRQSLEKLNNIHELVHLKINDASGENWEGKVLLKEIQKHSYKNKLIHLDFLEPTKAKPLNINIQIRETGECPGVKEGGVLQYVVREIPVSCMADKIPQYIEVDVSTLRIGQTLKVQDVPLPEEIQLKTQQNFPVISVVGRTKALDEEVSEVEEGLEEGQEAEETEAEE